MSKSAMSNFKAANAGVVDFRRIDPWRMARSGRRIEIEYGLETMERLAGMIVEHGDMVPVSADLSFSIDPEGHVCLVGRIEAMPWLVCQRCLEPMPHVMEIDVRLALVATDGELPAGFEALSLVDGRCDLRAIVEDELILALPIVAMHGLDTCAIDARYREEILAEDDYDHEETQRPFAGLADLLADSARKPR